MGSWDNLPPEIINCICSHLSNYWDLSNCQHTCSRWNDPVQRLIYSSIHLESTAQAILYIRTCLDGLGELATKINLYDIFESGENEYELDLLTCLATLCPNVKEIEALNVSASFWKRLGTECRNGHFKQLKQIPFPSYYSELDSYEETSEEIRTRLTNLSLCDEISRVPDIRISRHGGFWNPASRMIMFPRLNDLEIRKHTNGNILLFDDIIQNFPALEALRFTLYPNDNNTTVMDGFMDIAPDHSTIEADLSVVKSRPNIKSFAGDFVPYSDETIKYFMHKFPQLKNLILNEDNDNYREEVNQRYRKNLSSGVIVDFFKYVSRIPSHDIINILMDNTTDILAEFIRSTNFPGVVHIKYYEVFDLEQNYSPYIRICNTTQPQDRYHDDDSIHYYHRSTSSKIVITYYIHTYEENDMNLPDIDLIDKVGSSIQHFCVNGYYDTSRFRHLGEVFDVESCINHIFTHCSILKSLLIKYVIIPRSRSNSRAIKNKMIESLKFELSRINIGFLADLSIRLPLLRHLDLSQCTYSEEKSPKQFSHNSIKIDMPYTSFDTISFRYRDPPLASSGSIFKIYLKVVTDDTGGERYFFGDCIHGSVNRCLLQDNDIIEEKDKNESTIYFELKCKRIKVIFIEYDKTSGHSQTFLVDDN